jgi:hypothetical protein
MPGHGDLYLIFFFGLPNDLATVNQHIMLEKRIQCVAQEFLIFSEGPGCFEKRGDLLTHAFQKSMLEAPKSSQDLCSMLGMIPNHMRLVMGLLELLDRPTIPSVNTTIGVPNHHQFHPLFIQGQKSIHHENGSSLGRMT